jgi:hypothetical protein
MSLAGGHPPLADRDISELPPAAVSRRLLRVTLVLILNRRPADGKNIDKVFFKWSDLPYGFSGLDASAVYYSLQAR